MANPISLPLPTAQTSTESVIHASTGPSRLPTLYAVVQYDFMSERPDELDARAGEPLTVVAWANREWLVAKPIRRPGGAGLIPAVFLDLRDSTTGKPIKDVDKLIENGLLPGVEEWKRFMKYPNSPGPLDDSPQLLLANGIKESVSGQSKPVEPHPLGGALSESSPSRCSRSRAITLLPVGRVASASIPSYHFEDEYWFRINARYVPYPPPEWASAPHELDLVLHRTYDDFYDFQVALLEALPVEAGRQTFDGTPIRLLDPSRHSPDRLLPYIPGPLDYVDNSITTIRCAELNEYIIKLCDLVSREGAHVLSHPLIRKFFSPRSGDTMVEVTVESNPGQPKTAHADISVYNGGRPIGNATDGPGEKTLDLFDEPWLNGQVPSAIDCDGSEGGKIRDDPVAQVGFASADVSQFIHLSGKPNEPDELKDLRNEGSTDESAEHVYEAVQHIGRTNETTGTLHSNALKYLASTMYECLIQHGCSDLGSFLDPRGFSSSAIAEGGFGDIWAGRHQDGTKLAIKVLRFTLVTDDTAKKQLKRATREIHNWSRLDHENIHKLMGVVIFRERLGMVSRWMENGNLRQYLSKNSGVDRYQLCVQISKGIAYLHGINMIHGDLKACNILVSLDGVLKLTDFDLSIVSNCSLLFSETTRVGGGTLRWMAPELLMTENSPQRNKSTDIYALGMTFLETITNTHPYSECRHENQILFKHMRNEHPTRPKEHFPDAEKSDRVWSLLVGCWDYDPISRPTADAVLVSLLALG